MNTAMALVAIYCTVGCVVSISTFRLYNKFEPETDRQLARAGMTRNHAKTQIVFFRGAAIVGVFWPVMAVGMVADNIIRWVKRG